jgi:chorismate mutase
MIAKNFPYLEKKRVTQVQESYTTPNHQYQKRNTDKHIIIKTFSAQNKERILKHAKEKRQIKRQTHENNNKFLNSNSKHKKVMDRHNLGSERKQLQN